jgi:hypothetical protein
MDADAGEREDEPAGEEDGVPNVEMNARRVVEESRELQLI